MVNLIDMTFAKHYIGEITIQSLGQFISDKQLSSNDTILLHQYDFDELMLEYRSEYKEGVQGQYLIGCTLIKEDTTHQVPKHEIGVVLNDYGRQVKDYI